MQSSHHENGFSLVELSIVLVILGLLTGGILGGQSLIRAAELRALTTEFEQWNTAVNTFRSRYFALPGDMRNATSFWPDETEDGDGNGQVAPTGATPEEAFLFWQHLALAGLINGEYTGVNGGAAMWHHVPGENCPQSRIGGGWTARYWDNAAENSPRVFRVDYQHGFLVGMPGTISGGNMTYDPIIRPEEAWNIDTKFDDGRPARGNIHGVRADLGCTNAVNNADFDAEYELQDNSTQCALYFGRVL